MIKYGNSDYWEKRYQTDPEPFEWFQKYADLKELFKKNIIYNKDVEQDNPEKQENEEIKSSLNQKEKDKKDENKNAKILNIGCGNSRLSEDMYDDGYQHIKSIDSCGYVIRQMQEKYKDRNPNFMFMQMDARGLDFKNQQFDFIIDKGLFEAVLCGEMTMKNIQKLLSEIYRVLKPGGVYCLISPGQQELRLQYLQKQEFEWKINIENIDKPYKKTAITISAEDKDTPAVHYVYLCKKAGGEEQVKIEEKEVDKKVVKKPIKNNSRSVSKQKKKI